MEIIVLFIAVVVLCFVAGLVAGVRKMLPIIRDNKRHEAYKKALADKRAKDQAAFDAELHEQGWI